MTGVVHKVPVIFRKFLIFTVKPNTTCLDAINEKRDKKFFCSDGRILNFLKTIGTLGSTLFIFRPFFGNFQNQFFKITKVFEDIVFFYI